MKEITRLVFFFVQKSTCFIQEPQTFQCKLFVLLATENLAAGLCDNTDYLREIKLTAAETELLKACFPLCTVVC